MGWVGRGSWHTCGCMERGNDEDTQVLNRICTHGGGVYNAQNAGGRVIT